LAAEIEIVEAVSDHIDPIADRMRQADRDEVLAASGRSPREALEFSLRKSSFARTALIDGVPEVMFGVGDINVLTRTGGPWLLGTDAVDRHWVAFVRRSRGSLEQLSSRYAVLMNLVDARQTASIRWLRWLGFTVEEPTLAGVELREFRLFHMRAEKSATSV
jgi:hypothetical protein